MFSLILVSPDSPLQPDIVATETHPAAISRDSSVAADVQAAKDGNGGEGAANDEEMRDKDQPEDEQQDEEESEKAAATRSSKRVKSLEASQIQAAASAAATAFSGSTGPKVRYRAICETLKSWFPDTLQNIFAPATTEEESGGNHAQVEEREFLETFWDNVKSFSKATLSSAGRRKRRKRTRNGDGLEFEAVRAMFKLPTLAAKDAGQGLDEMGRPPTVDDLMSSLSSTGSILDLQRGLLFRLLASGDDVSRSSILWSLSPREQAVEEVLLLIMRLEEHGAGVEMFSETSSDPKLITFLLNVVELLAHFLPRRRDAVSELDICYRFAHCGSSNESLDSWLLSRVFLDWWTELSRRCEELEHRLLLDEFDSSSSSVIVMILARWYWLHANLEKREHKIERALSCFSRCASYRSGFSDWDHSCGGGPFLEQITLEGISSQVRKLEARRYVIMDHTAPTDDLNTSRMLEILCPRKRDDSSVSASMDSEELRIVSDAKEFLYTDIGPNQRCLLRELALSKSNLAEESVLWATEFLDIIWNLDKTHDSDLIFSKV